MFALLIHFFGHIVSDLIATLNKKGCPHNPSSYDVLCLQNDYPLGLTFIHKQLFNNNNDIDNNKKQQQNDD